MRKHMTVLAAFLAAGVAMQVGRADDKKVGTLKGVVKYSGDMSKANKDDKTEKDVESCGKERKKPDLLVDDASKGLADAVVYVKKLDDKLVAFADAQKKVVMDQKSCAFDKHVTLLAAGGELVMKNSDAVLHNVSFSSTNNGTFNQGIGAGKEQAKKFDKPEFITMACSVHPWMSAVLVVMQNQCYTVSDAKGAFSLELPEGKHTILVQHQTLGKADKKGLEIEIKAGETKTQDFEFK